MEFEISPETGPAWVYGEGFLASKFPGYLEMAVMIWIDRSPGRLRRLPVLLRESESGAFGLPYRCQIIDLSMATTAMEFGPSEEREIWWKRIKGLVFRDALGYELEKSSDEVADASRSLIRNLDSLDSSPARWVEGGMDKRVHELCAEWKNFCGFEVQNFAPRPREI